MTDIAVIASSTVSTYAPELTVENGQITTTSLQVAEHFGKTHKSVLRAIRNLDCSTDFNERNFAPVITEYQNGKGGTQEAPAFRIARDGFMFLAMGFTGKEAAQWKEAYITAFNKMESELLAKLEAEPRITYTVGPNDTLSAAQAEQLRLAFKQANDKLPKEKQAIFMTKGWSKLKSHFGCTYRKIPQREFSEALSLANRHAAEWELVDDSTVHPLTKEQADTLRDMMINASKTMPKDLQGALMHEGCLKLKDHFKVDYCDIPQARFSEAVSLLSRHMVNWNQTSTLPAPVAQSFRLLVVSQQGQQTVRPVPDDAFVMSAQQLHDYAKGSMPLQTVAALADACNMRLFMDASGVRNQGFGADVATKITSETSFNDLNAINLAARMEMWKRTIRQPGAQC
jgi:Rha family phage regulatory protein